MGYLCVTFSLPRPLCSRLRHDVRDRQTDRRQTASSLNAPPGGGRGHKITKIESSIKAQAVRRKSVESSMFPITPPDTNDSVLLQARPNLFQQQSTLLLAGGLSTVRPAPL